MALAALAALYCAPLDFRTTMKELGELRRPVRIAGGGLSGLSAAITLARAGVPVEVHERGEGPGCRHHFDLQGIENWSAGKDALERLREMGLEPDCPLHPVQEIHLMGRDLEPVRVRSDRPLAYLVERGRGPKSLDDFMRRTAESLGVPIRCGSTLARGEADIWAVGPPGATGIVSGYTFTSRHPFLCVCLLHDLYAPGGYVYLNIAGGRGTLAVVLLRSFRRARQCLEASRELLLSQFDFHMEEVRSFGGIGYFRVPAEKDALGLEVGEAGGFQDFLFGFGIYLALVTGHLAARSMLDGVSYHHLWREEIGNGLRVSLANRLLFELGGSLGRRYLIRQAQRLGPRAFLAKWYRFSPGKSFLYPLARTWARFRFSGEPGAAGP